MGSQAEADPAQQFAAQLNDYICGGAPNQPYDAISFYGESLLAALENIPRPDRLEEWQAVRLGEMRGLAHYLVGREAWLEEVEQALEDDLGGVSVSMFFAAQELAA